MELIEIVCLIALNTLSLVIGVVLGQMLSKQEKIEISPVKVVKKAITEHKEMKEKEAEDEYYKTIFQNIDNYTGDSIGQVDVPKRK